MRLAEPIKLITLTLALALLATGCGVVDGVRDHVSDHAGDSSRDRLAERSEEAVARLQGIRPSEIDVLSSDTVTLRELQEAGISIGSYRIECDQPLHMVVLSGVFDRDSLFSSGIALAGGSAESLAMRLVAEIYDPETDMPLGMIGDPNGASLNQFAGDSSIADSGSNAGMMLNTANGTEIGDLVPEVVCQ